MPGLLSTEATTPRARRAGAGRVLALLALALGLGAAAGWVWEALVELPGYTIAPGGRATTGERGLTAVFGSDAWFCVLGAVVGPVLGVVAWRRLRDLGWPLVVLVIAAAVSAALLAWWVGTTLGPGPFNPRLARAEPGAVVPVALQLRAPASLLVWPFLAVVPVLLGSSLGADDEEDAAAAAPEERRPVAGAG